MKHWLFISIGLLLGNLIQAQQAASVINIQTGQTTIVKADYIPFGNNRLLVQWPEGIKLLGESATQYTISGRLARPMDNIRFTIDSGTIDVPCRQSRKIFLSTTIQLAKAAKIVGIKGSFNNWVVDYNLLKPIGKIPTKLWLLDSIERNVGYEQFKLVINGKETDPLNFTLKSNNEGGQNAILKFGEPEAITPYAFTESFDASSFIVKTTNASLYLVYWNNELIAKSSIPLSGNINITIPEYVSNSKGRSYFRVFVTNKNKVGNDLLIPLDNGAIVATKDALKRTDYHAQIMYFMMVDRFANGDTQNDPKPLADVLPKAQYLGGDLKGIDNKIKEGYFEQLGINTLWLSPISKNPTGAWGYWNKGVTTKFSGYHGYWPTSYSLVDARFGNADLFSTIINSAHSTNTNIILDFVAHHIHTDHPLYKQHPEWTTPLYLADGSMNTERWDDHRLTTWFDTFLPTLNFEKQEVRELVTDSILFWVKNFDLDGFRHDASKHVPEEFWRLLTQKIKLEKKNTPFFQIGETYGSAELISSYVNSGEMNAQFDFNVYDASVNAFSSDDNQPNVWRTLQETISQSFDYYGYHHLMGNISGNQDRPRFASIADGSIQPNEDSKLAGWTRDIQNINEKGYTRMAQMMALNMTLPGIPVIYYGDEFAMPGGNDPDNRRMMKFTVYNGSQAALITKVKQLTNLRKNKLALLYGDYKQLDTEKECFAFERNYFGQKIIVVFSKKASNINLPIIATSNKWTELFDHPFSQTDEYLNIHLKADDVAIFILN